MSARVIWLLGIFLLVTGINLAVEDFWLGLLVAVLAGCGVALMIEGRRP